MSDLKYYNHDAIWQKRSAQDNPIWGSNSMRVYREVLLLLSRYQPAPAHIFDIGCGAGAFGTVATVSGYAYTGCDESRAAVELGNKSFPQLELFCLDMAVPQPRPMRHYDIVTLINSLHCLIDSNDRIEFLRNATQYAQGNGVLCLTTMCGPTPRSMPNPPRAFKEADEIKAELSQSGWENMLFEYLEPATAWSPVPNLTWIGRRK